MNFFLFGSKQAMIESKFNINLNAFKVYFWSKNILRKFFRYHSWNGATISMKVGKKEGQ